MAPIFYCTAIALLLAGAVLVYRVAYWGWRNQRPDEKRSFLAYAVAAVAAVALSLLTPYGAFLLLALIMKVLEALGMHNDIEYGAILVVILFGTAPLVYLVTFVVAMAYSHVAD